MAAAVWGVTNSARPGMLTVGTSSCHRHGPGTGQGAGQGAGQSGAHCVERILHMSGAFCCSHAAMFATKEWHHAPLHQHMQTCPLRLAHAMPAGWLHLTTTGCTHIRKCMRPSPGRPQEVLLCPCAAVAMLLLDTSVGMVSMFQAVVCCVVFAAEIIPDGSYYLLPVSSLQ